MTRSYDVDGVRVEAPMGQHGVNLLAPHTVSLLDGGRDAYLVASWPPIYTDGCHHVPLLCITVKRHHHPDIQHDQARKVGDWVRL